MKLKAIVASVLVVAVAGACLANQVPARAHMVPHHMVHHALKYLGHGVYMDRHGKYRYKNGKYMSKAVAMRRLHPHPMHHH